MQRYIYSPFLGALVIAFSQPIFAQGLPNSGSQLQQIPSAPQLPQKAPPDIRIEQNRLPVVAAAETQKILVNTLKISGASLYPEADLLALTSFKPGSELTLNELRAMAALVTGFYRREGYFVAQTFLPPQDIKDGAVQMEVLEGRYGQISLRNQSRLQDSTAANLLGGLSVGDTVAAAPLEQRLLMLSDLPGVKVKSTLTPGASVGASDLIIDISPGQRVAGSVDADNQGNRYTGANRIGGSVYINGLTGLGDVASVRVLSSGSGLNYGRAAYQVQLGKAKVGVAYAGMAYQLGEEFASAKANGTAQIASLYGSYPLLRSRNNNLYAQLAFDDKKFQDKQEATIPAIVADKSARVLMASLTGDFRDALGAGGLSTYGLTWSNGNINLQTADVRALDAGSAQSNGRFDKLAYSFARQQALSANVSLYGSINGQFASKNLDSSEKMVLGGAAAVRAYPSGEANADEGYVLTLEARMQLDQQTQLIGFVDTGSAKLNKSPWPAVTSPNTRTLSGAGLGVNWVSGQNDFVVKAYYAFKLGNEAATSAPDKSGRFWLQAVKYF